MIELFELKITNLREALRLVPNWASHTISLLDPGYQGTLPQPKAMAQWRCYYLHDISVPSRFLANYGSDFKLATHQQISEILEFTAPLQSTDKLLIHCHAGISRSTAVACGVLCQHGLTPDEAIKQVLLIRQHACPNSHIINLFDELLGLTGNLIKAVTQELDWVFLDLGLDDNEELS